MRISRRYKNWFFTKERKKEKERERKGERKGKRERN